MKEREIERAFGVARRMHAIAVVAGSCEEEWGSSVLEVEVEVEVEVVVGGVWWERGEFWQENKRGVCRGSWGPWIEEHGDRPLATRDCQMSAQCTLTTKNQKLTLCWAESRSVRWRLIRGPSPLNAIFELKGFAQRASTRLALRQSSPKRL